MTTEDTTIPLSGQPLNMPAEDVAQDRAAKASFGFGDMINKAHDDIYRMIKGGNEQNLRMQAASTLDYQQDLARQKKLADIALQNPNTEQLMRNQGFIDALKPLAKNDPDGVIEKMHAHKYMAPMWDIYGEMDPDAVNHATDNLTYKNYALSGYQKALDAYNQQSFGGKAVDVAMSMVPLYRDLMLHGGSWRLMLGDALEDERQKAYNLPYDQFKQWFDDRLKFLMDEDPSLAMKFAAAVVGQSVEDIVNNDATTLIDAATAATMVYGGAKGIFTRNVGRAAVQDAVKSDHLTDSYVRRMADIDKRAGIVTDITPEDIKATQAIGKGNAEEAAKNVLSKEIKAGFSNKKNPIEQEVKTFPDIFKQQNIDIVQNTGNLGSEIANRVKDLNVQRDLDIRTALNEYMRVHRTPALTASDDMLNDLIAYARGKYSGPNSTVMNVGRELIYDQPSNTYHMSMEIGDHNGNYFTNEVQAISHADTYNIPLWQPETTTRQFWDDKITALNFEIDDLKNQLDKFGKYTKQQFKPKEYYQLQNDLRKKNIEKRTSWSQRAGSYWKPDQPIESKLGRATLEKQGKGWYIQAYVPVPETGSVVRDGLLKIPGSYAGPRKSLWMEAKGQYENLKKGKIAGVDIKERKGVYPPYLFDPVTGEMTTRLWDTVQIFADSFLGTPPLYVSPNASAGVTFLHGIRNPAETMSPEEIKQRVVATHTPGKLADQLFGPDVKIMQELPHAEIEDFQRLLVASQNAPVPGAQHDHGYFAKDLQELEWFHQVMNNGRRPSEQMANAYFAYTRMYETERALRTLAVYRNMARAEILEHTISKVVNGKTKNSPEFHGQIQKQLPSGKGSVYINVNGKERVVKATGNYNKDVVDGVETGRYTVIGLWNQEDRPFHGFSSAVTRNTEPRWVITDSVQSKQINPNKLVPYRGGGHWGWAHSHYLKIPDVYRDSVTGDWVYRGDITAMPFENVAVGKNIRNKFNEIKHLIAEHEIDDARNLTNSLGVAGLDFDRDILPAFVGDKARFPLDHDALFELVPKGQTIPDQSNAFMDRYKNRGGIEDTTRSGNMSKSFGVEFTSKRDAWDMHTIEDKGTWRNPVYQYRPAQMIDPIDMMDRAITRISNQLWLDDYKYFSSEHWFQTYRPWLNLENGGAPFYHFTHPEWKKGTPKQVIAQAMSNRKKALDFVNMPSPFAAWTHTVLSGLAESVYTTMGNKAHNLVVPLQQIPFEKNPVRALRSANFDLKLGLGSIPAFFTQITGFVNVWALAPDFAPSGTKAMLLHQYARWMPQHLDYLDGIAANARETRGFQSGFSPSPGHFKFLWKMLNEKTDFGKVGSEHAEVNTAMTDRYIRNWSDSVRYWGRSFFREGAQSLRIAAWYTSGYKWFAEHPGQWPTTREAEAEIKTLASHYDHDMSRAYQSAINSGAMSVPAQFYTYDRNLAEQMFGKRWTWKQKARWAAISSMVWGLPFGGVGLYGVPLAQKYMEQAIDRGYIAGDGAMSMVNEGLVATAIAKATSPDGDMKHGWHLDIGRGGAHGWEFINYALLDDTHWYQVLGSTPTAVINTWQRIHPMWYTALAMLHGQPGVNLKMMDVADMFKEWSTLSRGIKLYIALKYGTSVSNNVTPLEYNETASEAITKFILGVQTAEVRDIGAVRTLDADNKAAIAFLTKTMQTNYNKAMLALKSSHDFKDPDYQNYIGRNEYILRNMIPENQHSQVLARMYKNEESLITSLNWNLMKNAPMGKEQTYEERASKMREMQNYRGQQR